jgi:hypothetical protein
MADGKLNNLLAALREVAADTPDPNDDDSDWHEDDPGDDGGDPNDDPRSYYPDETDTDDAEDQDQESDFRRRKPLGTVMLLQRLEEQAEMKADQDRPLAARRLRIKAPPTKLQQKSEKLMLMRRKSAEAERELKLNRQLEMESERLQKAKGALYRANMTDKERKQLKTDTDRMAIAFSTVCPEVHPDWRNQVAEEFRSKSVK